MRDRLRLIVYVAVIVLLLGALVLAIAVMAGAEDTSFFRAL